MNLKEGWGGSSIPSSDHWSFSLGSRQQHGRSETEEYSSDSESESEDEEELQIILEDLQRQNEELEVSTSFQKLLEATSSPWKWSSFPWETVRQLSREEFRGPFPREQIPV